nr:hypothetical protein [Candidatus Desulfobacula maris]
DYLDILKKTGWYHTHIIQAPMSSQRFTAGVVSAMQKKNNEWLKDHPCPARSISSNIAWHRFLVNCGMFLDNLSAGRYFTLSSNLK